jgi:hypothetical protein
MSKLIHHLAEMKAGRQLVIQNPDDLMADFVELVNMARESGRTLTSEMTKVALFGGNRNYNNYKKKPDFADALDLIDLVLADETINSRASDSMKTLILKNKYGYSEKIETVNVSNHNFTVDNEDKVRFAKELEEKYGIIVENSVVEVKNEENNP